MPGTLLNDQFGTLSVYEALDLLASRAPHIEALGITDYYSTASFRRALSAWQQGAGQGIRFLFPNVELRLDVPTTSGSGVNFHLMCAPAEVDGLEQFLGQLEFRFSGRPFRADPVGLSELGRAFARNASLDTAAALRTGANQFKVTFEALAEALKSHAWALEHCIVGVAAKQRDGSSGVRAADGSFAARRQEIEALAHVIFSGSPQDVEFWVGRGADSLNDLHDRFGGPKVCLHGSDAHESSRLGMPDLDRRTWLKGDATFDTLRLACLSPESRAHIGLVPPDDARSNACVDSVEVAHARWFASGRVPLSRGLVAIIGPRGSGKTALADIVAVGSGSQDPFANRSSFVNRAGALLRGATARVEWNDGPATQFRLDGSSAEETTTDRSVRYLSQQFVEQLCASDGVSDDLLLEIERVVFNSWPVEHRQGTTSFRELLDVRLTAARGRQDAALEAIQRNGDGIIDQRVTKDSLPQKSGERDNLLRAIKEVNTEVAQLTKGGGAQQAARLSDVRLALQARQQDLQGVERRITALNDLKAEVARASSRTFEPYLDGLKTRHRAAGLTETQWAAFIPKFSGDADAVVTLALTEAAETRTAVAGPNSAKPPAAVLDGVPSADLLKRTVAELRADIDRLQKLVGLDDRRTRALAKANDRVGKLRSRVATLENDIAAGTAADSCIEELTEERLVAYREYFDALLEEEAELARLYAPLEAVLAGFGTTVAKLRFVVRRNVAVAGWAKRGEDLLDLRVAGAFRGIGDLCRAATKHLMPAWADGDGAAAAGAIRAFSHAHSGGMRKQRRNPAGAEIPLPDWEKAVSSWLYSGDHIRLSYSLEYDGVDITRLSPGSRGIVLLLLYLAIDQDETDPLIIDQPEENLDPESVYTELVRLFRSASERRQIIMITHNANLVVNTDVDQVIVARRGAAASGELPAMSYVSGGLEQPEIRQSVCEVLEGGADAFRQRAKRLRIVV